MNSLMFWKSERKKGCSTSPASSLCRWMSASESAGGFVPPEVEGLFLQDKP